MRARCRAMVHSREASPRYATLSCLRSQSFAGASRRLSIAWSKRAISSRHMASLSRTLPVDLALQLVTPTRQGAGGGLQSPDQSLEGVGVIHRTPGCGDRVLKSIAAGPEGLETEASAGRGHG